MMLCLRSVALFLALLVPLTGGDEGSEGERMKARQAIKRLGVPYSREAFVEHLRNGDPLVVDFFVTAGMDPDERDKGGVTPLMQFSNEFAIAQCQSIIAMVAQAYQLQLVLGHPVEPEPSVTLRPRHGLLMTLQHA